MRNIKIIFEYDGSGFVGYQRQLNEKTVQGEIEKILNKLLKEEINLISSGRTDKGVHAKHQVANFFITMEIPIKNLKRVLNSKLCSGIKILEIEEVAEDFHARFSAKRRTYLYKMKSKERIDVFDEKYISVVKGEIESEKLYQILKPLIGKHNFESFRKSSCAAKNPFREIKKIKVFKEGEVISVLIEANAFLKSMIRIIMGTALAVYFGDEKSDFLLKMLENPSSQSKKIVAPANGLYLNHVSYDEIEEEFKVIK